LKIVPAGSAALKALLKSSPAAAKAVAAAAAAKKTVALESVAKLLANTKSVGMKLLRSFAKLPGVAVAAQFAAAVNEVAEADKLLEEEKIKKEGKGGYNEKVGEIVIRNMGSLVGGTIGFAIGAALGVKIAALSTLTGAAFFGIGAVPGAIIGAGAGIATALGAGIFGAFAGDQLLRSVFEYFGGDYEEIGKFIAGIKSGPEKETADRAAALKDSLAELEKIQLGANLPPHLAARAEAVFVERAKDVRALLKEMVEKNDITEKESEEFLEHLNRMAERRRDQFGHGAARGYSGPEPAAGTMPTYLATQPNKPKAKPRTAMPPDAPSGGGAPGAMPDGAPPGGGGAGAPAGQPDSAPPPASPSPPQDFQGEQPQQAASAVPPAPPAPPPDPPNSTTVVINTQNAVNQTNTVSPVVPASRGKPPPSPFNENIYA